MGMAISKGHAQVFLHIPQYGNDGMPGFRGACSELAGLRS